VSADEALAMLSATAGAAAPVDAVELLDDLHAAITRYVAMPSVDSTVGVTLWIAATHALPAFSHAPRLVIRSPEKRCGKSRLLDVVGETCHRPLITVNATAPAIFRSLEGIPPTLLVDEADAIFGTRRAAEQHEDLRSLLNAGHQRERPTLRCVGGNNTPTEFPTFAMAALAAIGDLPDTIVDRAIVVTMRRRRADEHVAQFRTRRDGPALQSLSERLASWLRPAMEELSHAEPEMPVEDRAADTWEPLVAVADLAGGDWPSRARQACAAMVGANDLEDVERNLQGRLLTDIQEIIDGRGFMASKDLVDELRQIPDAPWTDTELTARRLANKLRLFGVRPRRNPTATARGYHEDDFADAFARYTPQAQALGTDPSEPQVSPLTDAPPLTDRNVRSDTTVGALTDRTVRQAASVSPVTCGSDTLTAEPAEANSQPEPQPAGVAAAETVDRPGQSHAAPDPGSHGSSEPSPAPEPRPMTLQEMAERNGRKEPHHAENL
jgi:hypothetical protein